jgi:hypothetical protein
MDAFTVIQYNGGTEVLPGFKDDSECMHWVSERTSGANYKVLHVTKDLLKTILEKISELEKGNGNVSNA